MGTIWMWGIHIYIWIHWGSFEEHSVVYKEYIMVLSRTILCYTRPYERAPGLYYMGSFEHGSNSSLGSRFFWPTLKPLIKGPYVGVGRSYCSEKEGNVHKETGVII